MQWRTPHLWTPRSNWSCARVPLKAELDSKRSFLKNFKMNPVRMRCLRSWSLSLGPSWAFVVPCLGMFSNIRLKLYMALDAWVYGSELVAWNYCSPTVEKVYGSHIDELKQIEAEKPTSYHAILCKFFSKCMYVFPPLPILRTWRNSSTNLLGECPKYGHDTARPLKKTKTNYQNLPNNFSD